MMVCLILTHNVIRIYHKSCWRQLSYCGLHLRAVSEFGKKSDAVCGFLAYSCAVLRFSDPPYAPLFIICSNITAQNVHLPRRERPLLAGNAKRDRRIFLRVQEPILHFNDQWGPSGIISFFVKEKKALKLLLSSRKILFYSTNCKKCHLEFFAGFFFHLPLIKSFLLDNCKKRWHCLFHQR